MAGFNKSSAAVSRARVTSPIKTNSATPNTVTGNGAPAWTRDAHGELFLLAVTNMVSEDTFYEAATERDQRFRTLVRQLAQEDPAWIARFIPWLRREANMRTASVVAAVEFAQVHKAQPGDEVTARKVVDSALQRPDEPGEALAYARTMGYTISKSLKRGVADAVTRMYSERSLLKYDSDARGFRFGDVIELTHPKASAPWQDELFEYALTRRHGRKELVLGEHLEMLKGRAYLDALSVPERRRLLTLEAGKGELARAGMTWESLSGWLQGPMDKVAWEAIIPSMGYMALLRNLRNFDQAGVSDGVAAAIAVKLADPEEVAKSRQLPMRFLSAYNAAPSLRWAWALEQALQHSLQNVPELGGRTLILVDTSGSMNSGFSKDGSLKRWDAAALFGLALAQRCASADVVSFSSGTKQFPVVPGQSLLKALGAFRQGYFFGGGTATASALQRHFAAHDRVVVLTDEQADGRYSDSVTSAVPASVPLWNFNLAGYRAASTPSGSDNRHSIGGLSDHGFKLIGLLESHQSGTWPF